MPFKDLKARLIGGSMIIHFGSSENLFELFIDPDQFALPLFFYWGMPGCIEIDFLCFAIFYNKKAKRQLVAKALGKHKEE